MDAFLYYNRKNQSIALLGVWEQRGHMYRICKKHVIFTSCLFNLPDVRLTRSL